MKVFYLKRANYSNPQVLIIVAQDLEDAEAAFDALLQKENDRRHCYGALIELDTTTPGCLILEPPGDRQFIH